MPLIDCHVHTWEWLGFTPDGAGPTYWERCLRWAERFDATYVVSAPKAPGERLVHDPSPDYCNAGNQEVFDLIQRSRGRAVGLCYVNPRHTEASLAAMEEWIGRRGFVGLKLLTTIHCDRPELDPIVEWCAAHRVPVCQHTWVKANGNQPGESTPMMFAALARRHPDAIMVMYHTGGDFVYGAKAARGLDNVYCDIGGADAVDGVLEQLVDAVGAEHVLFGSDLPGRSLTSQLAKVLGARLSDAQKEHILYGNMARLLAARQTES
jgi:predicted TIM-barrel fold metal-dependent hydrolase